MGSEERLWVWRLVGSEVEQVEHAHAGLDGVVRECLEDVVREVYGSVFQAWCKRWRGSEVALVQRGVWAVR